jgi:hypothetical protein
MSVEREGYMAKETPKPPQPKQPTHDHEWRDRRDDVVKVERPDDWPPPPPKKTPK